MTKSQMKLVAESYAKYFGRAADADKIKEYGLKENGKAEKKSVILENIIADADVEKGQIDPADFVNNAFQNLFGRDATTKDINKYSKVIEKGKNLPINSIVKSAAKTDKAVYNNKMAVAVKYAELGGKDDLDLSKISKGNLIDIKFVNTVTTFADLKAKVDALADKSGIPSSFDGKTFVLTESVDAGKDFKGTNKDDLFVADNSAKVTASAADTLDGGKGTDTFKLYDDASAAGSITTGSLPTLKNIENVVIYDKKAGAAAVDLTKWDSVETLFLVRDAHVSGYTLGEKVTTVNIEDNKAVTQTLNFDKALTAATLGVNNVTTAANVTVGGVALKTLTVNASGKASTIANITNGAIETLDITGKADLTLTSVAGLGAVKTIDGSKAEGKLDLDLASTPATLKTVKTGTGDDKLTLKIAVATDTTIDLGAGNDKLVAGTGGSVAASTTTVIDGGAGIDSLSAALVTVGNSGVFASFETLSLDATGINLDLNLLTKSTFTTIAIDAGAVASVVRNVSTSQSLTVNAAPTTSTELVFKDAAGTADAYTINFSKDTTGVDAKLVDIQGIETVTVNSVGKTSATNNAIDLKDAAAKSLVITGDKALTVTFDTAFGNSTADATNGLGVSTIDASASTGGIDIDLDNVYAAVNGLTIKGGAGKDKIDITNLETTAVSGDKIIVNAGAGDDEIIVNAKGGILTGGAGNDTFVVGAAKAGATPTLATAIKTTITDILKGDKISGINSAVLLTKANVDGATNLDLALTEALKGVSTNSWFQYGSDTYLVINDSDTSGTGSTGVLSANDVIVKINGLVDLSTSTVSTTTPTDLIIA